MLVGTDLLQPEFTEAVVLPARNDTLLACLTAQHANHHPKLVHVRWKKTSVCARALTPTPSPLSLLSRLDRQDEG